MKRTMRAWKDEVIAGSVKKPMPILTFPVIQLLGITVKELISDSETQAKAMKLLAELDTKKGIGLIERIKQGQGKPTKIYVKRFTTRTAPPKPAPPPPEPFAPISEVDFSDVQKSEIPTPRGGKNRRAAVEKPDPNYTIAIQEIIKEYQRQKTNQRSRKGGSARKPQQYHAEAEVII